jgi:hypothetical protein
VLPNSNHSSICPGGTLAWMGVGSGGFTHSAVVEWQETDYSVLPAAAQVTKSPQPSEKFN